MTTDILKEENYESDFFRLDKNVAFNVLQFNKIEDAQTRNIVKSLVLYFSFQFQKDLFGYGVIDPTDFAEKMNFHRTYLSRKVPVPQSKKDGNKSEFNTYLENALYILATTTIFDEYKGSTDDYNFVGIRNHIILKELELYTRKTSAGGTPKKFYKYKLDENFERNLKKFFLITNLKTYLKAKSFNGEDFYLQLKNIYHSNTLKGINIFKWDFQYIIAYFEINDQEVKMQKYRLKKILNKYEEILKHEIKGINFYWEKANEKNKYAYSLCVKWDKVQMEVVKNINGNNQNQLFMDSLKRNLYDVFKTQTQLVDLENQEHLPELFFQWLKNKENDEIIKNSYLAIYVSIFKTQSYPGPSTYAQQFLRKKNDPKIVDLSQLFQN